MEESAASFLLINRCNRLVVPLSAGYTSEVQSVDSARGRRVLQDQAGVRIVQPAERHLEGRASNEARTGVQGQSVGGDVRGLNRGAAAPAGRNAADRGAADGGRPLDGAALASVPAIGGSLNAIEDRAHGGLGCVKSYGPIGGGTSVEARW